MIRKQIQTEENWLNSVPFDTAVEAFKEMENPAENYRDLMSRVVRDTSDKEWQDGNCCWG